MCTHTCADKIDKISVDCINASILTVKLHYSFAKLTNGRNWAKETRDLPTLFFHFFFLTTVCESTIISNLMPIKNDYFKL